MKSLLLILVSLLSFFQINAQIHIADPYCSSEFDGGGFGALTKNISKVEIAAAGFVNSSGASNPLPGYTYFNNLEPVALLSDINYSIKITYSGSAVHFVAVFIDFNQDLDFTDANEVVGFVTANTPEFEFPTSPTQFEFTIPEGAVSGKTRMRIMVFEDDDYTWNLNNTVPPACSAYTAGNELDFGEAEDYDVNINTTEVLVNDLNAEQIIHIYPNPASEIININTTTITIYYVELINASGEIIQRNYPNDVNVAISLNGFKPGIYLARVYTKHNQIIEKCFVVI